MDKQLEDILFKYKTSLLKAPTDSEEDNARFPDYTNKQKADLIKRYIDASNKFLLKHKKVIKKSFMNNINNPKITTYMSKYGYNELLVYDVKVKDAYIVLDIIGDPNDFEATEAEITKIKKDLKPFVKGKIFTGFAGGVKKWVKQSRILKTIIALTLLIRNFFNRKILFLSFHNIFLRYSKC